MGARPTAQTHDTQMTTRTKIEVKGGKDVTAIESAGGGMTFLGATRSRGKSGYRQLTAPHVVLIAPTGWGQEHDQEQTRRVSITTS